MKNKKRIGFVSYWGWGRGQAYVTLGFAKMLKDDFIVCILKQFDNPITDEFKMVDVSITENKTYEVSPEVFKKWVDDNKLDAVVFNEYNQWGDDGNNLPKLAKELGCKVYGYLVMEKFKKKQVYDYDRVLVPTVSMERFMRANKVRNFTHIPFSIDLNEFPHPDDRRSEKSNKFVFFHPGGWGGVHNRKNTDAVIKAFKLLDRKDTKLVITSQKPLNKQNLPDNIEIIDKNLDRRDLISLYYEADATVLPSKWETIGIPILESMAAGTPVITSDVPPMNEFIRNCMNGYTCIGLVKQYPDISVYAIEVSPEELKKKMELMLNKMTYEILAKNSRHVIETIYDLEKNKKVFVDFLKEELK